MIYAAFDTLDYARKLQEVGLSPKIAEKHAELHAKVLKDSQNYLATKTDLANLKFELLTKLGGMMATGFSILGGLITILGILITIVR